VLAREVYQFLYERWNLGACDRNAPSKQRRSCPIETLLARYNVTDPVWNDARGVFMDPKLTALYTNLTAKGTLSLEDVLEAGTLIAWRRKAPRSPSSVGDLRLAAVCRRPARASRIRRRTRLPFRRLARRITKGRPLASSKSPTVSLPPVLMSLSSRVPAPVETAALNGLGCKRLVFVIDSEVPNLLFSRPKF
jgi:hypothetical protein